MSDELEPRQVPEMLEFAAVELVRFTERLDELTADIWRRHLEGMSSSSPWSEVVRTLGLLRDAVAPVQDAIAGAPPIAAMRYACPRCGVGVGDYCVTVSGGTIHHGCTLRSAWLPRARSSRRALSQSMPGTPAAAYRPRPCTSRSELF